jgi:hypothetical protein
MKGRRVDMKINTEDLVGEVISAAPNMAMNAGLNVLVFEVVNETCEWKGSIRFTDAQANPVRGIKVIADPTATNK